MNLILIDRAGKYFLEGPAGQSLLRDMTEAVQLVEACFNHSTKLVLLHFENLTDHFFDLNSLEAGTILQKLRTYDIRLAVLSSPKQLSSKFRDLLAEEERNNYFRLFEDRQKAETWLLKVLCFRGKNILNSTTKSLRTPRNHQVFYAWCL